MQVDLHMHSSCSDGTLSPAQVMERARQQGLEIAALTDHDTLAGIAAAGEACGGVRLLTGLEITCAEQLWPGMDQPLSIWHGDGLIDIDCGCGNASEHRRLSCLRLDDMAEFYV